MNLNDFRAKAYGAGKNPEKKNSTVSSADDIKAKDKTENKPSSSQELENSVSFLKTGGLLKVPVEEAAPDGSDSVYRRVAKFLLLIGEDEAAKILPHLSETQIEKIIPEIASIRTVSKEEAADAILDEIARQL